jgi:DNA-directed RNA polymerase specialized sigma24 family protein
MQANLPHADGFDPRLVLWVSPVDDQAAPVDPVFLEAAERIGRDFFLYRARELNDGSRALELAERAVHKASRARKSRPVEDPVAYLFRTFTNMVDAELERSRRFLSLSDDVMRAVGRRDRTGPQREIDRSLEWREVLHSVDPDMQFVLWRLYWGFSIKEIAGEVGVTPNALSQRLSRMRKQLKKPLDPRAGTSPLSKVNGTRRSPRTHPGRDLPADGANRAPQLSKPGASRVSGC